jgi:hypothetical protein
LLTARLRDLTAKTQPRRTPDRVCGGPGAPGRARGDAPRGGRLTQGSSRTDRNPSLWATGARTRSRIRTLRATVGLAACFGMSLFPIRSSACFAVLGCYLDLELTDIVYTSGPPRRRGIRDREGARTRGGPPAGDHPPRSGGDRQRLVDLPLFRHHAAGLLHLAPPVRGARPGRAPGPLTTTPRDPETPPNPRWSAGSFTYASTTTSDLTRSRCTSSATTTSRSHPRGGDRSNRSARRAPGPAPPMSTAALMSARERARRPACPSP